MSKRKPKSSERCQYLVWRSVDTPLPMWTMWPSPSIMIFPLCRSFICDKLLSECFGWWRINLIYLENIASDGICRHGLNEVHASPLERDSVLCPVLWDKECLQIIDFCPPHLIPWRRIRYNVNYTTLVIVSRLVVTTQAVELTPGAVAVTR